MSDIVIVDTNVFFHIIEVPDKASAVRDEIIATFKAHAGDFYIYYQLRRSLRLATGWPESVTVVNAGPLPNAMSSRSSWHSQAKVHSE